LAEALRYQISKGAHLMVTCPRCQQPVDETVRTTCPLCFTPIPQPSQAAQPAGGLMPGLSLTGVPPESQSQPAYPTAAYAQPPALQQPPPPAPPRAPVPPGARVSLTGEVMDDNMPPGAPPSYLGGGSAAPLQGGRPGPAARAESPRRGQSDDASPRSGAGKAIGVVLALIIVLGAGAGGWFWWTHRTNPKDQALAVFKAYLGQDYKTAYSLTALSPETAKKYPTADSYSADLERTLGPLLSSSSLLSAIKSAAATAGVGEPTVSGDKADVPTSCQMSLLGRTLKFTGTAHMVLDNGIWKLDMRSDEPNKPSQATMDLVGKPDLSGLGGR
jgi:hypothetical protein